MSGGVDSSVAALLMKKAGYDVTGVFMRCYNLDGCAERDAEDARRVADHLGIPFYTFDFEKEYKAKVVEYMIAGYRQGITPNPDVMCNREIKFGLFLTKALSLGAEHVVTGHYVRLGKHADRFTLHIANDKNKDQSYFLWTLTQKELEHCLFPIGGYLKSEVREMARKAELPTAEKKDSQGVCFLGDVDIFDFLRRHIPEKRGDIVVALQGIGGVVYRKVGEHRGVWFYTIGQRHGLDLREPGKLLRRRGTEPTGPFYVAAKDLNTNTLVVAEGNDAPALFRTEITLADTNLISGNALTSGSKLSVLARVRYRQPVSEAILSYFNSNESMKNEGVATLVFKKPQKFVAPGQSAVFYEGSGEMLGGGVIE